MRLFSKALLVAVLCTAYVGCGGGDGGLSAIKDHNKQNITKFVNCYNLYADKNNSKGPKDEKTLKEFLKSGHAGTNLRLERMGIDLEDIDGIFTSERDGQPFKVRWALNCYFDHAIAFEQEGVDGKRMIALLEPIEIEAGDSKYDDYWNGKVKALPKGPRSKADMAPSDEAREP